jgi:hypothetical protein
MAARMPWSSALTREERVELLRLIRKMLRADAPPGDTAAPPEEAASPRAPAPAG